MELLYRVQQSGDFSSSQIGVYGEDSVNGLGHHATLICKKTGTTRKPVLRSPATSACKAPTLPVASSLSGGSNHDSGTAISGTPRRRGAQHHSGIKRQNLRRRLGAVKVHDLVEQAIIGAPEVHAVSAVSRFYGRCGANRRALGFRCRVS